MSKFFIIVFVILQINVAFAQQGGGQPIGTWPPFTKWYQNPLGISPLSLHTSSGIIVPTAVAGVILLITKNDPELSDRLSYYADFGYSRGYYGSFSNVSHQNIGVNYMLRNYLSLGAEFSQVFVFDDVNKTYGLGVRPFFRFYPVHKENFHLYFQSGAGLQLFAKKFPQPSGFFGDYREGTQLNGSPKYGIGGEFKISEKWNINAGIWHIHFSNGNAVGAERNPGHDSNGFSLGLTYKM